MNISLYRCFKADQRISMDVYADGLANALSEVGCKNNSYVPHSGLERFRDKSLVMRYLRYKSYSQKLKKKVIAREQIHHVVDHGYAHLYPCFSGVKNCISVHDLIPFLTWKGVIESGDRNVRKPYLNLYSLKYIDYFDRVITVSKSTANDLQNYLNIDANKIDVVNPVIDEIFQPIETEKKEKFRKKYDLDSSIRWLMISGAEYYKNHKSSLLVLKSLLKNTDYSIKLIKTGRRSDSFDRLVDELGLHEHVRQFFFQDVKELATLYNVVDCLLFPSLYEGFGMPITEALACGTPAVISDRASLPEAGGPFAIEHDCFDIEGMSNSVHHLFKNKSLKQKIYNEAPVWCDKFRSPQIGKMLRETYERI